MGLDTSIAPGDVGHIDDHEEVAELLSRFDGQSDFLATAVYQDILASLPAAGVTNEGLFSYATDVPALRYSDGSVWIQLVAANAVNQFSAINEFGDDVYFGSGKPWVDPMHSDFGATGDGVTNDQTPVQNAATAAAGLVLMLTETFAVDRISVLSDTEVRGPGGLVKRSGSSNNGLLHIADGIDGVTVIGIHLDAANFITPYSGGTVTQRACITIENHCTHVHISRVTMTNAGRDGIYMYSNGSGSPENVLIEHCTITNSTRWGIAVVNGVNVRVYDCDIDGGGLGGVDLEPNAIETIDNCIVERCRIYDAGHTTSAQIQATLGAGAAGPYRRIKIWNNYVEGIVDLDASTIRIASFPESSIIGNTVTGAAGTAIGVTGNSQVTVVASNLILDSRTLPAAPSTTKASISIACDLVIVCGNHVSESYWNGIHLNTASHCVVTGNTVHNVGKAAPTLGFAGVGIHVFNGSHNMIDGNLVIDYQGTPTMATGIRTQLSGAGPCVGNYVGANRVYGATGNNYSLPQGTLAGWGRLQATTGAILAGATLTQTITVTGARNDNPCYASVQGIVPGLIASLPFVSANDTVTLHITNVTAAPINPGTITTVVQMARA